MYLVPLHHLVVATICNEEDNSGQWGEKYHPDVATMLQQNFYVDDLLKSIKDLKTAFRLLYDIIRICAS